MIFLKSEIFNPQLVLLDGRRLFLPQLRDVLQRLGVLRGAEDLVELLLQRRRLAEGPVAVLLVHKDDVFQDGLTHAHL